MRPIFRLGCLVVVTLLMGEGTLFGQTGQTFPGTITTGNPTLPVVFITSPNCTGQGASPVLYDSIPFVVSTSGDYTLAVTSSGGFASVYLFQATFDPTAPFPTCIAGDNSGNPVVITEALTANVLYFAVPFDDTFAQVGGTYSLAISGPALVYSSRGLLATGAGPGAGPHVRVFDVSTGLPVRDFFAYAPGFTGGVRVALGDVNGDGIPDLVTGAGPGGGPHVRVFNGVTGLLIRELLRLPRRVHRRRLRGRRRRQRRWQGRHHHRGRPRRRAPRPRLRRRHRRRDPRVLRLSPPGSPAACSWPPATSMATGWPTSSPGPAPAAGPTSASSTA